MDSQKISSRLRYIDGKFDEAYRELASDAIFSQKKNVYLSEDKKRLLAKWEAVIRILQTLRWLIRTNGFQLSLFRNPNRFVVEHYARNRYYAMIGKLRGLFGDHEEFARSFLDDASREGFSTMARFAYTPRYFYFLGYPQEFLNLLEPGVDPAIRWMVRVPKEKETGVTRRLEHDAVNVRYYFRNRIRNVLRFIAIVWGKILQKISLRDRDEWYLSKASVRAYLAIAKPGDILLTRRNWVGTNLSIPGFWKHMSLYVGTGKYAKEHFASPNTKKLSDDGHYVVESTGTGVHISEFGDFSADQDYLGAFRTTFSEAKTERAIRSALGHVHREYDFSFDYHSDRSLVCSELVTKAYLPESDGDEWLRIDLEKIGYSLTYPPNALARKADREKACANAELRPVFFADVRILTGESFVNSPDALLKSWKRARLSWWLK